MDCLEGRVVLDAGQTLGTAALTSLGPDLGSYALVGEIGDSIRGSADVDLYALQARAGQTLVARTSLPPGDVTAADTYLRLFDAVGNELASNDNVNGGMLSRIDFTFEADGTYYVGVSGASNGYYDPNDAWSGWSGSAGGYGLDLGLYDSPPLIPDAVGDTLADALATGLGPAAGGYSAAESLGDGPYGDRDVELFQFQAQAGQTLTARTLPLAGYDVANTRLRLFDAAGAELASHNAAGPAGDRIDFTIGADGTYHVGLSASENGSYDPTVGGSGTPGGTGFYFLELALQGEPPPAPDAVGDTLADALATGLGPAAGTYTRATERLGDGTYGGGDIDLYRLEAQAGQVLTAQTAQPADGVAMDTYLRLFDAQGNQLAFNDDSGGWYSRIAYTFQAGGTYYVGVSGFGNSTYDPNFAGSGGMGSVGDYSLELALQDPPPPGDPDAVGDALADALATGLSPAASYTSGSQRLGDGTYANRDVDLYRFEAQAGQILIAQTNPAADGVSMQTHLRLFDAAGNELAVTDPISGSYARLWFTFDAAGTYYLGVSGAGNTAYNPTVGGSGSAGSTGDYSLNLALQAAPPPDAVGDTLATAQATGLGPGAGSYTVTGRVGDGIYRGEDVDVYSFQAVAGMRLTAQTAGTSGGLARGTYLRLFDAAGNELVFNDDFNGDYSQLVFTFETDGPYYLAVSADGNSSYDPNVAGSGTAGSVADYSLDLTLGPPVKKTRAVRNSRIPGERV